MVCIHQAGKGNAAGEAAAMEFRVVRCDSPGRAGFLMGAQILGEMSIDMLIDRTFAETGYLSLISEQPRQGREDK